MPRDQEPILFSEVQTLWQNLLVRVMVPMSSLAAIGTVLAVGLSSPPGNRWPTVLVAAFIAAIDVLLLTAIRMKTLVTASRIRVRLLFFPLDVNREDLLAADAVTYDPMGDFGGWGPKRSKRYGKGFTMSGDQGVLLTLRDGTQSLIGSRRSAELAAVLRPDASGA